MCSELALVNRFGESFKPESDEGVSGPYLLRSLLVRTHARVCGKFGMRIQDGWRSSLRAVCHQNVRLQLFCTP